MIKIYHNYQNVAYHKLIMYLIIVVEAFDKKNQTNLFTETFALTCDLKLI